MPTVLLTGATGFIGGRIATRLRERGDRVRAVVRTPSDALVDLGVEQHAAPLDEPEALLPLTDGVDAVVHTAAKVGPDLDGARRVNRDGTRGIAEAARAAGTPRLVHLSTTSVYDLEAVGDAEVREDAPLAVDRRKAATADDAPSAYAVTKGEAEAAVARAGAAGLQALVLRPPAVLGAGERSTWGTVVPARYRAGDLPPRPPEQTFGWVHVEDLVDVVLLGIDAPVTGSVNVVGGHTTFGGYLSALRRFLPDAPATFATTDDAPWRGRYATDRLPALLGVRPHRSFEAAMAEIERSWRD